MTNSRYGVIENLFSHKHIIVQNEETNDRMGKQMKEIM